MTNILDNVGDLKANLGVLSKNKGRRNDVNKIGETIVVPLSSIRVKDQVRLKFRDIEELGNLIKLEGQRTPLEVAELGNNEYQLITGERRYRALQNIKAEVARVTLVQLPRDDAERITLQITENLQRDDLKAVELAEAFSSLKSVAEWSNSRIAKSIGKDKSYVTRYISLASLPEYIRDLSLNDHTQDSILLSTLNQISKISEQHAVKLAEGVKDNKVSRAKAISYLKALRESLEAGEGKQEERGDHVFEEIHHRPYKIIRHEKFVARVRVKLIHHEKPLEGVLLTDKVSDEDGWGVVDIPDVGTVSVPVKDILLLGITSR